MPLRILRELKAKTASLRGPLIRTGVFVAVWAFFPWWVLVPVALYLYFVPLPQVGPAAWPFVALLLLAFVQPAGWIFAGILAALFLYLLLIKDLYIIERRPAYEILSLVLIFLLLRAFYLGMDGQSGPGTALAAFALAGLFAGMVAGFMRFPVSASAAGRHPLRVAGMAAWLLMFEIMVVGTIMPLDFIYQSAVVFLFAVLIMEFFPWGVSGGLSRAKVLGTVSVLFVLLVAVLGSTRWGW